MSFPVSTHVPTYSLLMDLRVSNRSGMSLVLVVLYGQAHPPAGHDRLRPFQHPPAAFAHLAEFVGRLIGLISPARPLTGHDYANHLGACILGRHDLGLEPLQIGLISRQPDARLHEHVPVLGLAAKSARRRSRPVCRSPVVCPRPRGRGSTPETPAAPQTASPGPAVFLSPRRRMA